MRDPLNTEGGALVVACHNAGPLKLVGLDPGYAAFGWAVAELGAVGPVFTALGVEQTKPAAKKRRLRKLDDLGERMRHHAGRLRELLTDVRPVAICIEGAALPVGRCRPSVIAGLGRCRGLVDMASVVFGVPTLEMSPQEVKRGCAGADNASKADMRAALESLYPELAAMLPTQALLIEHAVDAAAAIHVCRTADVVLSALRAREAA